MDVPKIPQLTLELIKKHGNTPAESGKTEGDYPIGSVEDDCQGDIEVGIVSQDVPKVPPGNYWPEVN